MVHNFRTLAGAFALTFVACSMFIACGSPTSPEPTHMVGSSNGLCDDPWQNTGSMAEARYMATTTRLTCPSTAPGCSWDGMVLVVGGLGGDSSTLGSAERYDPATGIWSPAGTLMFPRNTHRAVGLQDGRVLVVGGIDDTGTSTATAEIYNPATNTWSAAASMSADRYNHQLTLLADGRVLASGGFVADGSGSLRALATAEIYDPQRNQWQSAGSMAFQRAGAGAALLHNGRVLVAGGQDSDFVYLSSAEIFDPSNLSHPWVAAPSMLAARSGVPGAAVLKDGRVLVIGGTNDLPGAEIFDPAGGTWTPTSMVGGPRFDFQTIPLADGRVMVAGGYGSAGSAVEIFDPALDAWLPASYMNMSRAMSGAVELLPQVGEDDGRILIVGGYGRTIYGVVGATDSAETYLPCPPNAPPVAVCANQIAYTGPGATTCTAAAVSVDNGSYDPDNGPAQSLTLWQTPAVGDPLPLGNTVATLIADDGSTTQGVCQATITVVDNTPPQILCPTAPEIVECQSLGNTASEGQGSATFEDVVDTIDNCSPATKTCTLSGQRLPLGDHTVTCTSTDQAQNTASCNFVARVADTQPPVAGPSNNMVLWPADSGLVEVTLMDCAAHSIDACWGFLNLRTHGIITHITSDEPENAPGIGDGNTFNDMQVKKTWLALLRAERNSAGNGRVYTIHYRVTDDLTDPNARHTDSSCKVYVPAQFGTPVDQVGDDTPSSRYCVQPQAPLAPPPAGAGCP